MNDTTHPTPNTGAPTDEAARDRLLANTAWDLGRGTQVRIREIGEIRDLPGGDGRMSLDYAFVRRGRQSRLAVKKFLQRLVVGSLVCKMIEVDPHLKSKWQRQARRERAWMDRHVRLAPMAVVGAAPSDSVQLPADHANGGGA